MYKVDDTGKRFGRLLVLQKYDVVGNGETRYLCRCDCGNEVIVRHSGLHRGTQSCGCFQKDKMSTIHRKNNTYDLSGEVGIGYTINTNKQFYFDLDDYVKIQAYHWRENDQGYIVSTRDNIRIHRLIMGANSNELIDHINCHKADNRKINLRFTTRQLNAINRPANSNSKTGVKGVYKIKDRYYASIMQYGETIYLGGYATVGEASLAYQTKCKELFGDYTYKNQGEINET